MADKQRAAQSALGTNAGVPGPDGSDMSDAATAWEAVLGGEDGAEEHDEQADGGRKAAKDEAREEPDEDAPEADESDEEESDEGEEEEADEDDEDGEEDDEGDEDTSEIDPNTKVRVKIDGEEQEVTFDELKAGYSRTQDYTRKTQEVAEQRRVVEQEKDQVLQQQQQWSNLLSTFQQRLQASLSGRSEADWQALKQQDEIAYYEERDKERSIKERMDAIQAEQQRVAQEHQQRQQQQMQQQAQAEQQRLLEVIEEWKDPEVKAKEISKINDYAVKTVGFQPQELQEIIDHRAIRVLRDAAKYQELLKANEAPAGKAKKSKVRTAKTLKPGTPSNQKPSTVKRRKASQRLAKEHSVDAAAGVFEHLLED